MTVLLVLLCTFVACVALHDQVRRYPIVFYAIALAFDLVFVASCYGLLPYFVWDVMLLLMKKGTLAYSLFTVVMFAGTLPHGSKVRTALVPIRGELSIVAFLLIAGHIAFYASVYAENFLLGSIAGSGTAASLLIAMLMLALLIVLVVTSFNVVKKRMNATFWKKTQILAYPFYILIYIHLALLLLPSALTGGALARESMVVYSLMLLAYVLFRLYRHVMDCKMAGECE